MKKIFSLSIVLFFLTTSLLIAQTPPDEFLGHKVGADRKLADYKQIQSYFEKLDQESEKVKVLKIGKTTRGKDMIMALISSEKNLAELDKYKSITKALRDAKGLSPDQARAFAREGKVFVCITCGLHASEIAATQMSLEFAYNLATGKTPFDAEKILDDVIVLLVPSINPDGHQMECEYYNKYLGTKYEGGYMPYLYHDYAGHDNNRDWFMFNLSETRAVSKVLYDDWIPQIHIDEHQMGSTGARLFIPPFMDPPVPTIHPLVWRGIALCGTNMAFELQKEGYQGVVYDRSFTGWWIGACDDTSWLHNSIGLLSEMASVKLATPIYIDPIEVSQSYTEKRIKFPDPWPGGWWRLRDLVDYELVLSMSLIKTAHLYKEDFLYNFYRMNWDAIEKGKKGNPYAFVIPKEQHDYATTLKLLHILRLGGIEIHQASDDFIADGKFYKAGSFVVLMSQPYQPYAQALLEKQIYPDIREYQGGPPIPPYDNAGWTLPFQMGVACDQIDEPFSTKFTMLYDIPYPDTPQLEEDARYYLLDCSSNAAYKAVFALMNSKIEAYRITESIKGDEYRAPAGSFLIKKSPAVLDTLNEFLPKNPFLIHELSDIEDIPKAPLKTPRIGLYRSWRSNMDEGWTRYVLDDTGIPFTTIRNKDFKTKDKKKVNLLDKFDVIVFADEDPDVIKTGQLSPTHRWYRWYRIFYSNIPPDYEGGIGKEGVEALKMFVEKGGILVTFNEACKLIFKEFAAPAMDTLEKVDRSKFFCPMSILKILVDNTTPIGYGMQKETAAMFADSLAISTFVPTGDWDRKVVATYPKKDILMSGWLLGEEMLARKAAVVDAHYKDGHIILIGIRCQHRAQSHGTYKLLFNALLYPEL